MTAFEEYFTAVYDGTITACEKMKQVSEMLLERFAKPDRYHFDERLANAPIDFIEAFCRQPTGKLGVPLKLELFQKARLQALFGFVNDEGLRQYNECLIIEGRKNGKTTEIAALETFMLLADGEGAPQVYNLATARDQAMLGFNACMRMIGQSPVLSKRIRKRKSDLYCDSNMGYIMPLSSDTRHLDGLDVHCAVVDEMAAMTNRDAYDLAIQGMSARSQPLLFTITTNGYVRENVFDSQYAYAAAVLKGEAKAEHFLPLIYELDSPDEWTDESCWIKANPGLGTIKKVDMLRQFVQKALDNYEFKRTVFVKEFNLPQTSTDAWLKWEDIVNTETWNSRDFDYCIGGFDAADSVDLNSAKAICMRPGDDRIYVRSMYWIPQRVIDEQEKNGNVEGRDKVPYDLWIERGLMRAVPGNRVDKRVFIDWFLELRDEDDLYVLWIGYDPWHIDDSLLRDFKANFGEKSMIPVRQGTFTLSQPMKDMRADFQAHRIVYGDNPIDKWCLYNTQVKQDINGNIQPVKGLDRTQRIDGSISLLCAYIVLQNKRDNYINMNRGADEDED
jgi:phage terminase large subunit-like protein